MRETVGAEEQHIPASWGLCHAHAPSNHQFYLHMPHRPESWHLVHHHTGRDLEGHWSGFHALGMRFNSLGDVSPCPAPPAGTTGTASDGGNPRLSGGELAGMMAGWMEGTILMTSQSEQLSSKVLHALRNFKVCGETELKGYIYFGVGAEI